MSLSASCESVSQKRTLSSLLAGRVLKKPKPGDGEWLQEASLQLLEQQLDLSSLFREVGKMDMCNVLNSGEKTISEDAPQGFTGLLLVGELRRQAERLGVSVSVLSVKMLLDRLMEITEKEESKKDMLTPSQRVQLEVLLKSSTEMLSQGMLCPKLLWQELKRDQRIPKLEVVYHLHHYNIVTLKHIIQSDEEVRSWLVHELKTLCAWTLPQEELEEAKQVQKKVLSTVVGVLVESGFEAEPDAPSADRRTSHLCCSVLDEMLFWFLDTIDNSLSTGARTEQWIEIFDVSVFGASASPEALQRFFTHSLTQTLTYKPRLTVSDAISLQSDWTFAKASRLLTKVFRKLALMFSVEELLRHLQQVLETHEVNWKHVLCFCSTLLVYHSRAQGCLKELLSRLLGAAFEGYDLENMITAFLLARQGALEGPTVFTSYSDWFKMCFGSGSGFQASSKKSLVFLLKFLSDLVPFEPPQYLKVHILFPPYVPLKHRNLLMEYVSLAKTRLADLKESVEEMGLYEDVSAGGSSVQNQSQAVQDVQKALSLFETTGRISATVMEASIFRRPYFLTRFLPALLTPRMLPVEPDPRMSFIETLKKADKIPAAQYSSYMEACQKERQQNKTTVCLDASDDPLHVLEVQLLDFAQMAVNGHNEEMSAQLSRISHTLRLVFPGDSDQLTERQTVLSVQVDSPQTSQLHVKAVNLILRTFCQCLLDASLVHPPNKQSLWASRFISSLLANTQLLSSLVHRLWDLFHNQSSSLTPAHILGLGVLLVHLHASASLTPLVQLGPTGSQPVTIGEALSRALVCKTHRDMVFCVRLCLSAVCYGICRGDSLSQHQQQDYVAHLLYKKLLYLIPRLLPETRSHHIESRLKEDEEECYSDLWSSVIEADQTWRKTALQLWRDSSFKQLEDIHSYQLSFSEWLNDELRVQRSEDALTDAERQEYQQWACSQLYLTLPVERGGCGGDMKTLCLHLLKAILDQGLRDQSLGIQSESGRGTCLPDILSRLQEVVFEMEVSRHSRSKAALCELLIEEISKRCSATASLNVSAQLGLQSTLQTWNRVLLSLPPVVFIETKTEGQKKTLDCSKLIKHINQHQRNICFPVGLMSFHITAHLMKCLLCGAELCERPADEVNRVCSLLNVSCPLLLISAQHWWQRLSPLLSSMWSRLHDEDSLPEQLQLISECQMWASSLNEGRLSPTPVATALQIASSLHDKGKNQNFRSALSSLRPDRDAKHKQVLVFLFFFCMKDYLSTLLYPQDKNKDLESHLCSELLAVLLNSSDWLLLFSSNSQGVYEPLTLLMTDEFTRLMPWAFCSLLLDLRSEILDRTLRCPGFLYTAVSCYLRVLQLYLEGETPPPPATSQAQVDSTDILSNTKRFLLRAISESPPSALSPSQVRQLQPECADVDPELCAALSLYLDSNSPELDFM